MSETNASVIPLVARTLYVGPAVQRTADWLGLAAAPTFAAMALLTDGNGMSMHAAPLGGMVTMYLLMAAFHAPPWLRLVARRTPLV